MFFFKAFNSTALFPSFIFMASISFFPSVMVPDAIYRIREDDLGIERIEHQ